MAFTLKIDVTKIDKNKLFKGAKGTYLDVIVFEQDEDKYGNTLSVQQQQSKEERESKGKIYLGNGKEIGVKSTPPKGKVEEAEIISDDDDDLPF